MASTTVVGPIDQIRKADAEVEKQQHVLEKVAARFIEEGSESITTFAATARSWATRFNRRLPDSLSPDAQNEIRDLLLGAVATLDEKDLEERLIDHIDRLLVSLEAVRHVLRDAVDEDPGDDVDAADAAIRRIDEWLPTVDRPTLARVLGVTPRTIQRWLKDGGETTSRTRTVMQLMAILRRSWTPEGVVAWFFRRRADLGGRTPVEVLDDSGEQETLLDLARQGRAGHGD